MLLHHDHLKHCLCERKDLPEPEAPPPPPPRSIVSSCLKASLAPSPWRVQQTVPPFQFLSFTFSRSKMAEQQLSPLKRDLFCTTAVGSVALLSGPSSSLDDATGPPDRLRQRRFVAAAVGSWLKVYDAYDKRIIIWPVKFPPCLFAPVHNPSTNFLPAHMDLLPYIRTPPVLLRRLLSFFPVPS